jgi:hypothetical protein
MLDLLLDVEHQNFMDGDGVSVDISSAAPLPRGIVHWMPPRRPPPAAALPSARDLALPRAARDVYDRLLAEPSGDVAALLDDVRRHLQRFEAARAHNEFIPIGDARRLAEALPRLVDRARAHPDPNTAQRLAWVALRYFVLHDDGAHDFDVIGLDDDIAVLNAICLHLGLTDLCLPLA